MDDGGSERLWRGKWDQGSQNNEEREINGGERVEKGTG